MSDNTAPTTRDLIERILEGIDRTEDDSDGWWETSDGAQFGASKLAELCDALGAITGTPEREAIAYERGKRTVLDTAADLRDLIDYGNPYTKDRNDYRLARVGGEANHEQ